MDTATQRSDHARVELLRRGSAGLIGWQFRHPAPTAVWFRLGVRRLRLTVDGACFDAAVRAEGPLCFFPAGVTIAGEFAVDPVADYAIVFFDAGLAEQHAGLLPGRPLIGLPGGGVEHGLRDLARYARHPDAAAGLSVEGWALQALAHIARHGTALPAATMVEPGPPESSFGQVEWYVRRHLSDPLTVDKLAAVAGFSRRHFLRSFKQRTGQSPMRYVYSARLEEARARLATTDQPVATIATACGFSHPQHLDTAFRDATGMTPSEFRARRL